MSVRIPPRPGPRTAALAIVLAAAPALALLTCTETTREPATFRLQLSNAPETLDPAHAVSVYALGIVDRLFDGLTRLDRVTYQPAPSIAQSWTVSPDGRVYEFRLDPRARFHNGRRIRASDFVESWRRILAPDSASPSAWLLEPIAGAREFQAGLEKRISGLEAEDPDLLRVRLEEPFAPFLYHLATPATAAVPREAVASLGEDFAWNPVGSGPYRLVERLRDLRLVLEAVEGRDGTRPEAERLIFEVVPRWDDALRMFRAGRLDLLTRIDASSLSELRREHSSELHALPGFGWQGFCFRCDRPPFDDPRVRRAFALVVDRAALVRKLGGERFVPSVTFLPAIVPGHDPESPPGSYDLERARALLAEAGYGPERPFPAVFFTGAPHLTARTVAMFVTESLMELDVPASYHLIEFPTLLEGQEEGRWELHHEAWLGDYPHPEAYLRPLFHSRGSANVFGYESPEVDHLLDAARLELDEELQLDLYRQAERRIRSETPCVVLLQETEMVLLSSRWTGIPLGFAAEYLEVERARKAER